MAVNSKFETFNPFPALMPAIFGEILPHTVSHGHFVPLRLISGLGDFRADVT